MEYDPLSAIVLDALLDHVALLDADGTIIYVNAAWQRFAQENGAPEPQTTGIGANYLEICHRAAIFGDALALQVAEGIQAVLQGRQPSFRLEYACHSPVKQGWYEMRVVPLAAGDHRSVGRRVVVLHESITERKLAELRQAEVIAILSQAEAIAHIGSWKWEFATNQVTWSEEMCRIFGVDPHVRNGDLAALIDRAIHPGDRERVQAANERVLTAHDPVPLEYRILRPDGEERLVYAEGRLAFGPDGRPVALLGSIHDRTDLMRAEAARLMDEWRLRALYELSGCAHSLSEPEIIQLALKHAVTLTASQVGYLHFIDLRHGTIQLHLWSRATPAQPLAITETRSLSNQARLWDDCVRVRRPVVHNSSQSLKGLQGLLDGHAPQTRHLGVPILDSPGSIALVIGVGDKVEAYDEADIQQVELFGDSLWKIIQRTRAEARLQLQSVALESAATPMVITNRAGVIEWANPAYAQMTGYSATEVLGQNPRLLRSGAHSASFYAQMWETILAGQIWHGELTNRRKNGQLYEEEQTITPVRDESGAVTHFIAIKQDISERKQREREQQIRRSLGTALGAASARTEMIRIILSYVGDLLHTADVGVAVTRLDTGQLTLEQGYGIWHAETGRILDLPSILPDNRQASSQPHVEAVSVDVVPGQPLLDSGMVLAHFPLYVARDPFGALLVCRDAPFRDSEQRILLVITEVASNALHRAMLHEQTARHLQRMQSLHRLDKAINSGAEMEVVIGIALDEIGARLMADAIAIMRVPPSLLALERIGARGLERRRWDQALRVGAGYAGQVALTHESIFFPELTPLAAETAGVPLEEGFMWYHATPLLAKGQLKGVLELLGRRPVHNSEWRDTLAMFTSQLAITLDSADMAEGLKRSHAELMHAYETTIEGWSHALDLRDKETEGHTLRVTEMTVRLAGAMGLSDEELLYIRRGALLHDIGKMGVPDHILLKPGPLTDEEQVVMRRHPNYAYEMLAPITFLDRSIAIPYCHHERYDGSGYPRGLAGAQIPLAARIFAVVDVWDALRSDRPYRAGWPEEHVRTYIQEQAGRQFDPQVINAFMRVLGELDGCVA